LFGCFVAPWLAKAGLVKTPQFAILLTDFGGGHRFDRENEENTWKMIF
jgi:hypothetical protein